MPRNENPSLPPRHVCIIGDTGAGKSVLIRHLVPRRGVRVLAFDPDKDHSVHHFDSGPAWIKAVISGVKSGKPYRIGWVGSNANDFVRFCTAAFEALDGNVDTHVICEEAADFCKGSGPARDGFGTLLRRARKYAGIVYTVGQRAAELPTTVRNQSQVKYIGFVDPADRKAAAELGGLTVDQVAEIKPGNLEFWVCVKGQEPYKKRFPYKAR